MLSTFKPFRPLSPLCVRRRKFNCVKIDEITCALKPGPLRIVSQLLARDNNDVEGTVAPNGTGSVPS